MSDEYKRLLAWAKETSRDVKVNGQSNTWSIAVSIKVPVAFDAFAGGSTLDEAAERVIEQLESVSGGKLEDIGEDPSSFGIA